MNAKQTTAHSPGKPMLQAKPATLSLNNPDQAPSANAWKTKSRDSGKILKTTRVGNPAAPVDLCPDYPGAIHANQAFRDNLDAVIPSLRAFSRGLCGRKDVADALAQEAIICGWAGRSNFAPGANFMASMFRVLRDRFYLQVRTAAHFIDSDLAKEERDRIAYRPQRCEVDTPGILLALQMLPAEEREVVLLVEAASFSAEEAAWIVGCSVGKLKKRLTCARAAIAVLINAQAGQIQLHKAA